MTKIFRVAAAMAAMALSAPAFAQEVELIPLTPVETLMSGFPESQATDVLGVDLGMTRDEVYAIMAEKYPTLEIEDATVSNYEAFDESLALDYSTRDGYSVGFEPSPSTLVVREYNPGLEYIYDNQMTFIFGTDATHEGLQGMARFAFFDPPALKADLIASLTAKYGVEAVPAEQVSTGAYLINSYRAGEKIELQEGLKARCNSDFFRDAQVKHLEQRVYVVQPYYKYQQNREVPVTAARGCDASIFIQMSQIVGFPDQIGAMKIYVYDHLAAYQDMKAIDDVITAGYDAYLNTAPTETTTPDL